MLLALLAVILGLFIYLNYATIFMTEVIRQDLVKNGEDYIIRIPGNWEGGQDRSADVIIDEICLVVPDSIANATGELLVLRLLEAMINSGIISADDVQKAVEHIV